MNRSGIALTAAGILIGASSIWVAIQNRQLREELAAANATIRSLRAGAFKARSAQPLRGPLQLILLDEKGGEIASSKKTAGSQNAAQCEHCSDISNQDKNPSEISTASLLDIKHRYLSAQSESDFTLFIFFSPTDCPACLRESIIWQRLFEARDALHLSVIGIVGQCSRQEAETARSRLGITFPLLFDVNAVMAPAFGLERTPEKILVNRAARVILTSPPYQKEEMQQRFEQEVRQSVGVAERH